MNKTFKHRRNFVVIFTFSFLHISSKRVVCRLIAKLRKDLWQIKAKARFNIVLICKKTMMHQNLIHVN